MSAAGGGMSGGMGTAAMAYQAPNGGPSSTGPTGTTSTNTAGPNLMKSNNITDLQNTKLPEDDRSRGYLIAVDLENNEIAYLHPEKDSRSKKTDAKEVPNQDKVMTFQGNTSPMPDNSVYDPRKNPIKIKRNDQKAYKSLKKFLKKGYGIESVVKHSLITDRKCYISSNVVEEEKENSATFNTDVITLLHACCKGNDIKAWFQDLDFISSDGDIILLDLIPTEKPIKLRIHQLVSIISIVSDNLREI